MEGRTPGTLTRSEVARITLLKCLPITGIGHGVDGEVWYAVRHNLTNHVSSGNYPPSTEIPSSQLIAVKMHVAADVDSAEAMLLFHDIVRRDDKWLAMTAIHGPLVNQVTKANYGEVIPQPLIAHTAVQLHSALSWMHSLVPAVTHGDIHMGNMMYDLKHLDPKSGLPNVVLIDFGLGSWDALGLNLSWEHQTMYAVIHHYAEYALLFMGMVRHPPMGHAEFWDRYMDMLHLITMNTDLSMRQAIFGMVAKGLDLPTVTVGDVKEAVEEVGKTGYVGPLNDLSHLEFDEIGGYESSEEE
ncbi:hypothetical protein M011DRAFT_478266 [Sporormia fimetaria CBS 119925]|uniref:Protein kinase domain-containing protein n=1 Tax=Sporormia fimetaria CBS 119925 TaxID=1340428 RepID=A0A6A6V859_9PLEO|nr:hypothetical protein M011DRAFT_478266 [Sporormia fimetaria CBS 119925]